MSVAVECPEPPVVVEEAHPAPTLDEGDERPQKKVRAVDEPLPEVFAVVAVKEPTTEESEPATKRTPGAEECELLNCTPHEVHYYRADDSVRTFPSATVLRSKLAHAPVKGTVRLAGEWFDVYDDPNPVLDTEDVPRLKALAGKAIVVSRPMAMAIKESGADFGIRVLTPNSESTTKQGVRNEKNELCGVRSFIDWGML